MADFIGRGWAFPMRTSSSGGVALVDEHRELQEAMRLILGTYPGERPMRPEFGSRLRDYVFAGANDSTASSLVQEVRAALLRWEPRVDINDVIVTIDSDEDGLMYIDIQYTPKTTNDARNLVFPFYSIPTHRDEFS